MLPPPLRPREGARCEANGRIQGALPMPCLPSSRMALRAGSGQSFARALVTVRWQRQHVHTLN